MANTRDTDDLAKKVYELTNKIRDMKVEYNSRFQKGITSNLEIRGRVTKRVRKWNFDTEVNTIWTGRIKFMLA